MSFRRRVPGLVLALSGLALAAEASTFDVAFLTDPVGPKALPYLAAFILVLAGAHAAARPPRERSWPTAGTAARAGAATGAFLLYAAALPTLGFFVATTLVVSTLSALFGAPPRKSVAAAALLTASLWVVFVLGLGLPLPIGTLWIR